MVAPKDMVAAKDMVAPGQSPGDMVTLHRIM